MSKRLRSKSLDSRHTKSKKKAKICYNKKGCLVVQIKKVDEKLNKPKTSIKLEKLIMLYDDLESKIKKLKDVREKFHDKLLKDTKIDDESPFNKEYEKFINDILNLHSRSCRIDKSISNLESEFHNVKNNIFDEIERLNPPKEQKCTCDDGLGDSNVSEYIKCYKHLSRLWKNKGCRYCDGDCSKYNCPALLRSRDPGFDLAKD